MGNETALIRPELKSEPLRPHQLQVRYGKGYQIPQDLKNLGFTSSKLDDTAGKYLSMGITSNMLIPFGRDEQSKKVAIQIVKQIQTLQRFHKQTTFKSGVPRFGGHLNGHWKEWHQKGHKIMYVLEWVSEPLKPWLVSEITGVPLLLWPKLERLGSKSSDYFLTHKKGTPESKSFWEAKKAWLLSN